MKKILTISISVLLAVGFMWFFSTREKVPAGYRGVIVNNYGSDKGIAEKSVGVGRYYLGWNKEMFKFPTFLQNYTWTKDSPGGDESITMQTSEGLSINTDAGITYDIKPENVVKVFQKYRLGIDEITNTFLRNMVRDSMNKMASTMSVEDIYGSKKDEFITKVNELVKAQAEQVGIEVDKVYLVNSFNLPASVIESINAKANASQNAQKVENEVATAKAEAQKILITANAQAEANKILAQSLTPEFVRYKALEKWDGKLPTMMPGNATPFVSVGQNHD